MTGKDLKEWMEANDKTTIDVASASKTHPQTVQRFLEGRNVHRATLEAFKRLVVDGSMSAVSGGSKAAKV